MCIVIFQFEDKQVVTQYLIQNLYANVHNCQQSLG